MSKYNNFMEWRWEQDMKNSNKPYNKNAQAGYILPIIGILLSIFIIAGGTYYLKIFKKSQTQNPVVISQTPQTTSAPIPSPDPTANWKTYTSNSGKFSLKYPPEFKIQNNQPTTLDLDIIYLAPGSYPLELNNGFALTVSTIENKTVDEAAEDLRLDIEKYAGGMVTDLSTLNKTVFDNKKALFYTYMQKTYLHTKTIFINPGNNRVLNVSYIYAGPDNLKTKYSQWGDQILSTFKFTDQQHQTNQM